MKHPTQRLLRASRAPLTILTLGLFLGLARWHVPTATAGFEDADNGRYVFADLADAVIPSIVTVYVKVDIRKELDPDMLEQFERFRQLFPMPDGQELPPSTGSGIIISKDGYILTNHHVVGQKGQEPEITVVFHDDSEVTGEDVEVIESSWLTDLAVIKVKRDDLKPVSWGDSEKLRIGERVAAVGSPLDLRQSVTQGIICAKQREVGDGSLGGQLLDMIQTDAVINPGSSGGALVNLDGELVGINRLITTNNNRWQGYGFAIPSNDAREFAEEVMTEGEYALGYIGISMHGPEKNNPKTREAMLIDKEMEGVLVEGVASLPDGEPGPAEKAGVQVSDYIIEVDGARVKERMDLLKIVAKKDVGETLKIKLLRLENGKSKEKTLKLKIAKRPTQRQLNAQFPQVPGSDFFEEKPKEGKDYFGMELEPYEDDETEGLKVTRVKSESPAEKAGIKVGDVLTKLNGTEITSIRDLKKVIEKEPEDRDHVAIVARNGKIEMMILDAPEQSEEDEDKEE